MAFGLAIWVGSLLASVALGVVSFAVGVRADPRSHVAAGHFNACNAVTQRHGSGPVDADEVAGETRHRRHDQRPVIDFRSEPALGEDPAAATDDATRIAKDLAARRS